MPARLRVLITGGSGLLGRSLVEQFSDGNKWEVLATAYSRCPDNDTRFRKLNLLDEHAVCELVTEFNPHVIVHAAAERRPDVFENDTTRTAALNVSATALLAKLASEIPDTFLIYISTDYVFDGTNPPYKPNSPTNPLNEYGKTKRDGEISVWEIDSSAGVLRVPILYGPVENLQESAVTSLIPLLQIGSKEKKPIQVDDYAVRFPTYTKDVARCVRSLAERRMKHCSLSGTWHFSGNEQMSKYQMLIQIAELLNVPHDHIQPISNPDESSAAKRPHNSQLDTSAMKLMGFLKITPYKEAIKEVLELYKGDLSK